MANKNYCGIGGPPNSFETEGVKNNGLGRRNPWWSRSSGAGVVKGEVGVLGFNFKIFKLGGRSSQEQSLLLFQI